MNDNREFIEEFLVEAAENLDQVDRDLLALEERPEDLQPLASIFRTVHTIKGNSGFFGFSKLGALTHSGEHLLGRLRDGKVRLNGRVTGTLYSMVDAVRSILQAIEETGVEGEQDYRELAQSLVAVALEDAGADEPPRSAVVARATAPEPRAAPPGAAATPPAVNVATAAPGAAPLLPVPAAIPVPAPAAADNARPCATAVDPSIRVDVGLLASILDLVGELVLARNELRSVAGADPALEGAVHRINAVTNALQEAAVKTRMQPIEHVFNKFPRTVRDLAVSCGREVQLVIDGADTELDRTLVERIRDPLTHLVRNAVDHGIEPPDAREAAGKPRAGRLRLRAFNESGQVTIEVQDDGAGIAVDAVRAKAVARGLVDAATAESLPDERVLQFIFEPGFSTAAQVTSVSGRGVGMDVVKTNIEAIGGTVDVSSARGVGTTVRVRVPLTLAIVPALVVRCGAERFALPLAAVGELLALRPDGGLRVEGLASAPVIRLRGRLVPVVFLDALLGLPAVSSTRDTGTVVIVRVDDHEFGLVVDGTNAGAEAAAPGVSWIGSRGRLTEAASLTTIVVKPIGGLLAQLGLYGGATVLGDGGVVLILDPRGIRGISNLPPAARDSQAVSPTAARSAESYLVCQTAAGRRVAVPLDRVARLEKVTPESVQQAGERRLVRRGDSFTDVVDADRVLGLAAPGGSAADGPLHLVVLDDRSGGVGLAVRKVIDVAVAESVLQPALAAPGVSGTLAVAGLATEVLDLAALALPPSAHPPLR
jgi:two-component system chemotaxis sensor kinase CheA